MPISGKHDNQLPKLNSHFVTTNWIEHDSMNECDLNRSLSGCNELSCSQGRHSY
jgi:hypothetical protein